MELAAYVFGTVITSIWMYFLFIRPMRKAMRDQRASMLETSKRLQLVKQQMSQLEEAVKDYVDDGVEEILEVVQGTFTELYGHRMDAPAVNVNGTPAPDIRNLVVRALCCLYGYNGRDSIMARINWLRATTSDDTAALLATSAYNSSTPGAAQVFLCKALLAHAKMPEQVREAEGLELLALLIAELDKLPQASAKQAISILTATASYT